MPKCCIPGCSTKKKKAGDGVHLFRVPRNREQFKKWQEAIPKMRSFLKAGDRVCHIHFLPCEIKTSWCTNIRGNTVETLRENAVLIKNAVPSIFYDEDSQAEGLELVCDEFMSTTKSFDGTEMMIRIRSENDDSKVVCDGELPMAGSNNFDEKKTDEYENDPVQLTKDSDLHQGETMSDELPLAEPANFDEEGIRKLCPSDLPFPWSITETYNEGKYFFNIQHIVNVNKNNEHYSTADKSIRINENGYSEFFIFNKNIDPKKYGMPEKILNTKELLDAVCIFQSKCICFGLGGNDYDPNGLIYKDFCGNLRLQTCPLIIEKGRLCTACWKYKQSWLRKKKLTATKKVKKINISAIEDPLLRQKFQLYRQRIDRLTRIKNRKIKQIQSLKTEIKNKEDQLSKIKEENILKKCEKQNIPHNQQIALLEILKASQKQNPKGRRYSDEWLMLCMLLNIRNPSNYEFIRKNEILPLPCAGTVRRYFSLVDIKCGFDANFAQLLKKHFAKKNPMERHGIIILDEINLRTSIKVSAKNLTYSGLIDFGEDGPQAKTTEEQADHGLVFMFQPLADKYTQPFAVFASKSCVKGEELAKLMVKAIIYLEDCGAFIHGVNGDGAATNYKMFRLLGVNSELQATKSWFNHPVDERRKIFAFSDVPHLIKNIRNRLYNQKTLKVDPKKESVKWKYFEELLRIDSRNVDHLRVCPRISKKHVYPDNTLKMRVRPATQMLSHSTATGLTFYRDRGFEEFNGCEETIKFCLTINSMFDALNIKSSKKGLTTASPDFKVLKDSLDWLNEWKTQQAKGYISEKEFLTSETERGLRLSLQSTIEMCQYLMDKYEFPSLLTGRINQDNLEKFFGMVRQGAGANDHPDCNTFLQIYKILSMYSILKPPRQGNCTVDDNEQNYEMLVTLGELKDIYAKKDTAYQKCMNKIKNKLDAMLDKDDEHIDTAILTMDNAEKNDALIDHNYYRAPVVDCIIYYLTGYLVKQLLKKFKNCEKCVEALTKNTPTCKAEEELVALKSKGSLIHPNLSFFSFVKKIEMTFLKYHNHKQAFEETVDDILENADLDFPCSLHSSSVISYSICYFLRMRMLQYSYQDNHRQKSKFVRIKKTSKLMNQ